MRFLKSFSLLHRRSKSDTALTLQQPIDDTPVLLISLSSKTIADLTISAGGNASQHIRCSTSFNHRMFELRLENQLLSQANASLAFRLASTETRLRLTGSELYAEMHKNVHLQRQTKKDNEIISELRKAFDLLHRFLQSFPDAALAFKNFDSNYLCADAVTENTPVQSAFTSRSIGNVSGRESEDNQYTTALQLVLKTRQELRSCKKIVMFWKRKAKLSPEHADLVTPSPSEISEVQNTLTKERRDAVEALQRRRQLMTTSGSQVPLVHTSPSEESSTTAPVARALIECYEERHSMDLSGQVGEEQVKLEVRAADEVAHTS